MTFPHFFVPARWERRLTGHMGFTYLVWTFVDLTREQIALPVHAGFRRHEQRHVQQSVAVTFLAGALVYGLTSVFDWSHLWVFVALLAWPVVYGVTSVVWKIRTGKGYTDSFWERDARRYEERTR